MGQSAPHPPQCRGSLVVSTHTRAPVPASPPPPHNESPAPHVTVQRPIAHT